MNIHYKIVELWPDDHLIVARYWTDNISEESLASDLNRKQDGTPVRCRSDVSINLPVPMPTTSEEIGELVKIYSPFEWLNTLEAVQDPNVHTALDTVIGLVGVTKKTNIDEVKEIQTIREKLRAESLKMIPEEQTNEFKELSDDDIQKLIEAVNVKSNG
jgi:hypothetical protein